MKVLLFTDLVDSTAWKKTLGDRAYAFELRQPHDHLFRALLAEYPEAWEQDNAGDGFLAVFATPGDAVAFALRYHRALAMHAWGEGVAKAERKPTTRIGIHLGEVVEFDDLNSRKVAGQAVDLAARVMGLGQGGQTLLTRHAFDSARQHVRANPSNDMPLAWVAYGQYRFKGNDDDPLEIFGVGDDGSLALAPPGDSEKAIRVRVDAPLLGEAADRLRELEPILEKFPRAWPAWRPAYLDALPADADRGGPTPASGSAMARELARYVRQSDGTHPLERFVRSLLARPAPAEGPVDRLRWWLEGETGPAAEPRREARAVHAARLVVRLESSSYDTQVFFAKAWVVHRGETVCFHADDPAAPPRRAADIPTALEIAVAACHDHVDLAATPFRVELLVPRQLLGRGAEELLRRGLEWLEIALDLDLGRSPLGYEYPVLFRPLDRYDARAKAAQAEHRKRGPAIGAALENLCPACPGDPALWNTSAALHIPRATPGGVRLRNRLIKAPQAVCAVLEEPPAWPITDRESDVLNGLLIAGMPVAVWLREGCPVEAGVTRALAENVLKHLPEWVHARRREGWDAEPENHFGRHIALIWDDPNDPIPETQMNLWRTPA